MQQALQELCKCVAPYYSPGGALLHLGTTGAFFNRRIAGMEGFSRVLWGLAPLIAGGSEVGIWDMVLNGIRHGTDPCHEEYWGDIHGCDQRMVEMGALGFSLALIPEKIGSSLNDNEKSNLAAWLDQINRHPVVDSNWLFFRVLVNLGLKRVGAPYNQRQMDRSLTRIDRFYLGDGWYSDGPKESCDYYNAFGFHFYSLIYAKLSDGDDPKRAKIYRERAARFGEDFIHWFAKDGSAIPFGRSMTYRFAASAFWGALAFAGVEAQPWGVVKRIHLQNLRWWLQKPILANDGLLTIGYSYPNLNMAEGYNGPGSPYWAFKAFLPLSLGEEHPFWRADELPMDLLEAVTAQKHPRMIIIRQDDQEHIVALSAGRYPSFEPAQAPAKYSKFAYSNRFGFSISRGNIGLEQLAPDSMLALSEGDGIYRVRRECKEAEVKGGFVYARWCPWDDVEIRTWLIPAAPWHVRIHIIKTRRALVTAEGGFALERDEAEINKTQKRDGIIGITPREASGIIDLHGRRKAFMVYAEPNTNLIYPRTLIPVIKGKIGPGTHLLVAAVLGSSDVGPLSHYWNHPPVFHANRRLVEIEYMNQLVFSRDLSELKRLMKRSGGY